MLLFLWMSVIIVMWGTYYNATALGGQEEPGQDYWVHLGPGLLLAVPPTVLFLVCFFVLFQAAPTVQFNAGSEWSLSLWSFWVDAWGPLFLISVFLCVAYFLSTVVLVVLKRYRLVFVSLASLVASGVGCFVLSITIPSA